MNTRSVISAFCAVSVFAAFSVFADGSPQSNPSAKPQPAKRVSPGFLEVAGSQKGLIAIVNNQSRIPAKDIEEVAAFIQGATHCRTQVAPAEGAQVVIEIIDNDTAPALTAYPEDFKATVNVGKVGENLKGSALDKFLTPRVRREILRAFCFACGAGGSQYPDNIMAIGRLSDLDLVGEFIPGDTIYTCQKRLRTVGVTQTQFVPYARACKEGWAPAPTNDAQKVVWERVKALKEQGPTNPIKIPPPDKK